MPTSAPVRPTPTPDRPTVGIVLAGSAAAAVTLAAVTGVAVVLSAVGWCDFPRVLLGSAAAVGIGAAVARRLGRDRGRGRGRLPRLRVDRAEVALLAVGVVAAIVVGARVFDRTLLPVAPSVDTAHHLAAVSTLLEEQRLPDHAPTARWETGPVAGWVFEGADSFLGEMAGYPPAAHLAAALLSWTSGLDPLRSMNLLAFAVFTATVVAVGAVGRRLALLLAGAGPAGPAGLAGGFVAMLVYLAGPSYGVGVFTGDFFFGQLLGLWLAVVVLWAFLELAAPRPDGAESTGDRRVARVLLPVAAGLMPLTYPLHAGLAPAGALGVFALYRLRRRWLGQPSSALPVEAVPVAAVLAATAVGLALYLPGRTGTTRLMVSVQGALVYPSISRLGGPIGLALAVVGVAACGWAVRRVPVLAAVLVLSVLPVLQTAALLAFPSGIGPVHWDTSRYTAYKSVYLAFPLGCAIAGGGAAVVLGWLARAVDGRRAAGAVAAAAVAVLAVAPVAVAASGRSYRPRKPAVSAGEYTLARWAARRLDGAQVAVGGTGLAPYLAYVGVLHRPRDGRSLAVYFGPSPWPDWPDGAAGQRYLLTTAADAARLRDRYPTVRVLRTSGRAVLLDRG